MQTQTPVSRTLELAARTMGGVTRLAEKLNAPVDEVERWIAGIPPPPDASIYLRAIDIVSAGPLR